MFNASVQESLSPQFLFVAESSFLAFQFGENKSSRWMAEAKVGEAFAV
jgi:hypothetical protein